MAFWGSFRSSSAGVDAIRVLLQAALPLTIEGDAEK